MEKIIDLLLMIHIAAGSTSLILFWIPAFARKRRGLHTLVGKWYVRLMWVVVISAALLSLKNMMIGRLNNALFLGFLSLITMNPLWSAISIMKSKREFTSNYINRQVVLHAFIVLFGLILLIYGMFYVDTGVRFLMMFFGFLGVADIGELIRVRKMRSSKPDWYRLHYSGMISTGIAAYTAFFAFGGRQFLENILTNEWQLIPWILPTVIGVSIIRILNYRRKVQLGKL